MTPDWPAMERDLVITPEERFAALFERTHQPLLAYAVRRVAYPADAADVVAETFLVAWRRLDDVPAGEEARPWLFGVARRVLANLYRTERRRGALTERLRESLSEVVGHTEVDLSPVEVAMAGLGDDDRELLRLVAWEELARDEIAIVLGVSRATVRVRLHRARQRLLRQMEVLREEGVMPAGTTAAGERSAVVRRNASSGHVVIGRASARLGAEEGR
jgi:RNA polymerase sigma-70 factor (ECF subfamily)